MRVLLLVGLLIAPTVLHAQEKIQTLIDTDIGSHPEDAFALALALSCPELDIGCITTSGGDAETRAWLACRFLTQCGRKDIPVAWGRDPQPKYGLDWQIQYRRHPAAIFNRTLKPAKESAVDRMAATLRDQPGMVIALGPLTNVAQLLQVHPAVKDRIRRIIVSEGPEGFPHDAEAARAVIASGVPLVIVPRGLPADANEESRALERLFAACTLTTFQVQNLMQLWEKAGRIHHGSLAVALATGAKFLPLEPVKIVVDAEGRLGTGEGKPNARQLTSMEPRPLWKWYTDRVAVGPSALPPPMPNPSKIMPNEGMPNRVHCWEDYETDIEKRWWMSGKLEIRETPPRRGRANRAVLTQDFDDRQGDMKAMFRAVIFNPVPGPPMGKSPRLRFKYYLDGATSIKVQIYSLTKGYHRCLTLHELPQRTWQEATVDMTKARRPDGSGGTLSENERIDDVQFYIDPRAELVIDDLCLYDAPVAGEKRPWPEAIYFTGIFDTGKQGKEWPGTFEIIDQKGFFWRAAHGVPAEKGDATQIRIHLRGSRTVAKNPALSFRYLITGGNRLNVRFLDDTGREAASLGTDELKVGTWNDLVLPVAIPAGTRITDILFTSPNGSRPEILLDDLLFYAPGRN